MGDGSDLAFSMTDLLCAIRANNKAAIVILANAVLILILINTRLVVQQDADDVRTCIGLRDLNDTTTESNFYTARGLKLRMR